MGMLIHHDWLEQQEQLKKQKPVKAEPVEEVKEEPVKEPVKRGGRRTKK